MLNEQQVFKCSPYKNMKNMGESKTHSGLVNPKHIFECVMEMKKKSCYASFIHPKCEKNH
jgi:hypothetical protein